MDAILGAKLHKPCRHPAPAGVVDANEQHLRVLVHDRPLRLREGAQPLTCEAVHEHWHEIDVMSGGKSM